MYLENIKELIILTSAKNFLKSLFQKFSEQNDKTLQIKGHNALSTLSCLHGAFNNNENYAVNCIP